MYRALLVDDEPMSLVSLKHVFNWSKYGFEVVFQTTNPSEAFEKICNEEFDVVFTDIRMPKISGLDLIRKVNETGVKTTFIIVSGFGEFNYAKQALHEGVFDYCLKPVCVEDADQLLSRLSDYLNSKQDSYDIDNYNLLINGLADINEFMSIKKFKPSFEHYQAVCLLIEESNMQFNPNIVFFDNVNNIKLKLSKNKYIYILNYENSITTNLYQQYIAGDYASLFSLGFSSITKDVSHIADLIKEADISANKYSITGINDFYEYTKSDLNSVKNLIKNLIVSIDYMKVNSLKDILDNVPEYFKSEDLSLEDAVYLWNQMVSHLSSKYGTDDLPKDFEFLNFSEIVVRFKTFSRMCDYLEEVIFSITNILHGIPEGVDTNESIKKLIDYVNQNYCSDISMKDLSNMFHINYTYCCELYKKVMGITFSEYVTGLRMKKAVNLLDNSDLSIEKIAMETGYSDYYYFNNVFKKYYNITPSKHRKSSRN